VERHAERLLEAGRKLGALAGVDDVIPIAVVQREDAADRRVRHEHIAVWRLDDHAGALQVVCEDLRAKAGRQRQRRVGGPGYHFWRVRGGGGRLAEVFHPEVVRPQFRLGGAWSTGEDGGGSRCCGDQYDQPVTANTRRQLVALVHGPWMIARAARREHAGCRRRLVDADGRLPMSDAGCRVAGAAIRTRRHTTHETAGAHAQFRDGAAVWGTTVAATTAEGCA
jgi:hypothetical protein